jgi:hypothetical protein
VLCLKPCYKGKALAFKVSNAKANLRTRDVGATCSASVISVANSISNNFATYFATLSKASTTSLLAFA